ncbi:uncharacterized protein [Blastocystis hominis]|uniref:Uncharacterized protein n=1 Tax=Blastocystis hominis TaxID=12968 RepID=D8MBD0_BLAHO|nr:uncharacterized protein [Blastocystis hominis]CBK25369.2 unnamed protein product [Blastocystis hominis]|eukprot:XP_012899417.1 uncharacterized protein [Blastocystis hominis]
MDELQKATLQVVFEHFRFNGFYSSSAPSWTFAKHLSTLDPTDINRHTRTGLVIESGFSFTHIIPIVDGSVVLDAVRRVNVGGKLLTNLLKETLSFRQMNVQDCFYLVNKIKEAYSYLSLDVLRGRALLSVRSRSRKLQAASRTL